MSKNEPIISLHPLVRLFRLFLWLSFIFILLFGSIALSLRNEYVQTRLVSWLAEKASEKLGYRCSIGGFYLDWVDYARLTGVRVLDKEGRTMIELREVKINLKVADLLEKNINLDFVGISGGLVEVIRSKKSGKINISGFSDAILDWINGSDTSRSPDPPVFSIDKVRLEGMTFGYIDETEEAPGSRFDYYHFHLDGISGIIHDFWQRRDSIRLQAEDLVATDRASRLEVKSLTTNFGLTAHDMFFRNLSAGIGNSLLRDSLGFRYKSWADFGDFNHRVQLSAKLDSSRIQAEDLAYFAPVLQGLKEEFAISGFISGRVDNLLWKDMLVKTRGNSRLQGNLSMRGLPETSETFTDLRLKSSRLNPDDLQFFAGKAAADYLGMLGIFDVSGSFTGFFRDFATKSTFQTALGTIKADMQMKLSEGSSDSSTYNGQLKTIGFDLGRLLQQRDIIQRIDFDGSFQGRGFDPDRAEASVKASISSLGILGYDYKNIVTDAKFSRKSFNGELIVKDPNLLFSGKGKIDLSKGVEEVDFDAMLSRANCQPLKLTKDALDLSAEISLHFSGFDFDDFKGSADVHNFRVLLRDERMDLPEASLNSQILNGKKTFSLQTPLADVTLNGSFKYKRLAEDAIALFKEYQRLILNRGYINEGAFIARRRAQAIEYDVESRIKIKKLNELLDLLDLPLTVSPGTIIDSDVHFGQHEQFNLSTSFDSIRYENIIFSQSTLKLKSDKLLESSNVDASLEFRSKDQHWGPRFNTEKLGMTALWDQGKISYQLKGKEKGSENEAMLNGEFGFFPNEVQMLIGQSYIRLFNRNWNFSDSGRVTLADAGGLNFKGVELVNGIQSVSVSGAYNGEANDSLIVQAKNVQLEELKALTGEDLKGKVDGKVNIRQLGENPLFEGSLKATGLAFRQYPVGDFEGTAIWNQGEKNLAIDGNLLREGSQLFNLYGFYTPNIPNPLDMRIKVQQLGIDFLQPLIGSSVSGMKGRAAGELNVKGDFSRPEFSGNLYVKDGQVKINYLNTTYFFNPRVQFTPDEIFADGAILTDENGKTGILKRASLRHRNFSDFQVDLNADLTNFQVFNIPKNAGEVYYGTGICTGNLQITGGFEDISISARAKTNKGTRLFIPLDQASSEDIGESFITFQTSGPSQKLIPKDSLRRKINLSGIRMDFDLDVTEDAYGEIIFDQKAGDIIRATGAGKIKLGIDTRGDFSVIGQYVIKKGDYHFTTYNLVNKDFDIQPGSTITWNGPVLGGVMDIRAEYNLNATLSPLIADALIKEKPEAKRRYPVVVSMRLTDQLLKPVIALGLDIRDYPKNSDWSNYIQAFLARISTDEQELNRQVFSLMIFRMFAPQGEFTQTAGISYSSFSDLVSNQLSSWLSQFDENLEVSVDLAGLSQADLNNFQLRFSYTMLDGRLRLTRDGGFTNTQNQASALSIAGDWSLEYMLSKNGLFRVKMFHRINQNLISGLNNNFTTQGASLLHTQSFNKISELFPKRKKRPARKQEPARKPENQTESAATLPAKTE